MVFIILQYSNYSQAISAESCLETFLGICPGIRRLHVTGWNCQVTGNSRLLRNGFSRLTSLDLHRCYELEKFLDKLEMPNLTSFKTSNSFVSATDSWRLISSALESFGSNLRVLYYSGNMRLSSFLNSVKRRCAHLREVVFNSCCEEHEMTTDILRHLANTGLESFALDCAIDSQILEYAFSQGGWEDLRSLTLPSGVNVDLEAVLGGLRLQELTLSLNPLSANRSRDIVRLAPNLRRLRVRVDNFHSVSIGRREKIARIFCIGLERLERLQIGTLEILPE